MITILVISQVLLWVVLAVLVAAGLALARQLGVLFERVAPVGALTTAGGPAVGAIAPRIATTTLEGKPIAIGGPLAPGMSRFILFVSSQCPICKKLIPVAVGFARIENVDLIFAGDAPAAEQRRLISEYGIEAFPFVNSSELGVAYGIDKLPHAVLLDERGIIVARGLVNSREHLESLIESRDLDIASVQEFVRSRLANTESLGGGKTVSK